MTRRMSIVSCTVCVKTSQETGYEWSESTEAMLIFRSGRDDDDDDDHHLHQMFGNEAHHASPTTTTRPQSSAQCHKEVAAES